MDKKRKRILLLISIVLSAGLIILWGINKFSWLVKKDGPTSGPRPAQNEERIPVNLFRVKAVDFQDALTVMGTIKGGTEIELKFQIEGRITGFNFKEGDRVRKNEVIARLNDRDAYLKLKQAELELEQYKKMYEVGAIVLSKLKQARLAAEMAKSDYEKTVLCASQDGIITSKNIEIGEYVTPNMTIATLSDIGDVFVEVGIIEKDVDKIVLGQKMVATVDSYPGIEFSGIVFNIAPTIESLTKTLPVKGKIVNDEGLLLPGMFARAKIFVFDQKNIFVIPASSLETSENVYKTFVVGEDNIAQEKTIEVGYLSRDYAQVTAGVVEGETVVDEKPENLKDGSLVEIIDIREYGQTGQANSEESGQASPSIPLEGEK